MQLHVKLESGRYREATGGEVIAAALSILRDDLGLKDEAFEIEARLLNNIGYIPPKEAALASGQL